MNTNRDIVTQIKNLQLDLDKARTPAETDALILQMEKNHRLGQS